MKVEATGMVTVGECQVKTDKCQATTPDPITVVYLLPEETQVNVCRACLEEKMRKGEWQIEGARLQAV